MRCPPYLLIALLLACEQREGPYGESCETDDGCGPLRCIAKPDAEVEDLDPLPLVCGDADETDVGLECQSGERCGRGICLLAGSCASPCQRDADCAEGEHCVEAFARIDEDTLASVDACVAISDLGEDVEVDVQLAAVSSGETELELEPLDRLPPTLAVIEHLDPDWPGVECRPPLCLLSLRTGAPDPVTLFDSDADYRSDPPPAISVATGDHISPLVLQLPGKRAPELSADGYVARLESERGGKVRITRVVSDGGGRKLDLNVFYVGKLGLQPEGARVLPVQLRMALEQVDEIFAQVGISIGEVRQIVIPGALPMRGTYFSDGGDPGAGFAMLQVRYGAHVELPGLFQLSAGAGNRALDIFLLEDIEPLVSGQDTEAQAGGIPGPPAMHGTSGSGIAVSAADMITSPAGLSGRTLAHEIAHYLGLFHTSEADGSVIENLPDTPECREDQDLDGDGLTREECAEHGADNLMFWAKSDGVQLSVKQSEQLRASPLLY